MVNTEGNYVAVAMVTAVASVLSGYAVRRARLGRPVEARLDGQNGTVLLGRYPIEAFHWALRCLAGALLRTGVAPDTLTFAALVVSAGTLPLTATGHFELAGLMLLLGSAFDAFDGIVARARGVACPCGEILDSVVDRYADSACLIGLGIFYRTDLWALIIVFMALVGSMMVSYVRAKAEAFGLSLPSGLMRRPERIAYLSGALVFGRPCSAWLFPAEIRQPVTLCTILMIGVLSNLSAIQLLNKARGVLSERQRST